MNKKIKYNTVDRVGAYNGMNEHEAWSGRQRAGGSVLTNNVGHNTHTVRERKRERERPIQLYTGKGRQQVAPHPLTRTNI